MCADFRFLAGPPGPASLSISMCLSFEHMKHRYNLKLLYVGFMWPKYRHIIQTYSTWCMSVLCACILVRKYMLTYMPIAVRLLRACCATRSPHGLCTFPARLLHVPSHHVRRAGSTCAGRSPISFRSCLLDMIAAAGGNGRALFRAEVRTDALALLVGSSSRGNFRRCASKQWWAID